jgi:hypothetical protein
MTEMQEVIRLAQAGRFDELSAQGVQISDGKLEQTEGWAKPAFHGQRAHYFTQLSADAIGRHGRYRAWRAVCGAEAITHDRAPMFGIGSWERCKACLKRRNAARSRDATISMQAQNMTRQEE